MNLIANVLAGNVRRTAEIVFGDPHSEEYLDLKNYKVNPHRETYGWTSNNSIFAELGMDYTEAPNESWIMVSCFCLVRKHETILKDEKRWRQ